MANKKANTVKRFVENLSKKVAEAAYEGGGQSLYPGAVQVNALPVIGEEGIENGKKFQLPNGDVFEFVNDLANGVYVSFAETLDMSYVEKMINKAKGKEDDSIFIIPDYSQIEHKRYTVIDRLYLLCNGKDAIDIHFVDWSNLKVNGNYIYRYNITNDEFTLVYTGSNSFQSGSMVAVGTDIYIMGCRYYGSTYEGIFKYDTINNTGSVYSITLSGWMNANYMNIPCVVGNLIYIFGSESNSKSYVIDTLNTTITQIANLPMSGSTSITTCNVGNYIYIITTTQATIYKYNIINDTYTAVNPPNKPAYGASNYIYAPNDDVIVFISKGSSNNISNIYNFALTYNAVYDYENNSVVVWDGFGKYKTQLTKSADNQEGKIKTLFYDAYHYTTENGLDDTIPTYYGDGTQWIKFKN